VYKLVRMNFHRIFPSTVCDSFSNLTLAFCFHIYRQQAYPTCQHILAGSDYHYCGYFLTVFTQIQTIALLMFYDSHKYLGSCILSKKFNSISSPFRIDSHVGISQISISFKGTTLWTSKRRRSFASVPLQIC